MSQTLLQPTFGTKIAVFSLLRNESKGGCLMKMHAKLSEKTVLDLLRKKWCEVPGTLADRVYSSDLLEISDDQEFLNAWFELYKQNCGGNGFNVRGWYHELYTPLAKQNGEWLEVGSGLGFDGVFFAGYCGAKVTFLDIITDNLAVIERVCKLLDIKDVKFKHLKCLDSIHDLSHYDVIMAIGSLINAPYPMMSKERKLLADHLKADGRWLELAYPKERWVREGCLPFDEWGKKTDGENTPYMDWYDLPKILHSLRPHKFDVLLNYPFHNHDFIFFDLMKSGAQQTKSDHLPKLEKSLELAS